jgi:hypothetical protein
MSLTQSILATIRGAGFATSVHHMPGYIEMHAVHLSGESEAKISRMAADERDAEYRCAVAVPEMVGIELEE